MLHNIPNAITVIRIILIFPTAWFLWIGDYVGALVLMAIAGGSDAVDGALARRFSWTSRFGEFTDPLADKLLVGVMLIVFTLQGHVPLWLAIISIGRDLIILSGALAYRLLFEKIEIDPTFISKANTAMQITMLIMVLVRLVEFQPPSAIAAAVLDPWGFAFLAVLSVISGFDYVVSWTHRAIKRSREST